MFPGPYGNDSSLNRRSNEKHNGVQMNNGKYYKKMIQLEKLQSQMRSIILPYYSREFIIGQTYVVKMKNHATRNLFRYTRQDINNQQK